MIRFDSLYIYNYAISCVNNEAGYSVLNAVKLFGTQYPEFKKTYDLLTETREESVRLWQTIINTRIFTLTKEARIKELRELRSKYTRLRFMYMRHIPKGFDFAYHRQRVAEERKRTGDEGVVRYPHRDGETESQRITTEHQFAFALFKICKTLVNNISECEILINKLENNFDNLTLLRSVEYWQKKIFTKVE